MNPAILSNGLWNMRGVNSQQPELRIDRTGTGEIRAVHNCNRGWHGWGDGTGQAGNSRFRQDDRIGRRDRMGEPETFNLKPAAYFQLRKSRKERKGKIEQPTAGTANRANHTNGNRRDSSSQQPRPRMAGIR